ncbi:hypothetical protein [Vibrio nigripulchritudo]|uniref:hypothetical protein n=1 Tax=Vibrio nigripulchritudo TaxID=28173 RepID=UPI00066EDA98|nr:hypothetical protein [Vibrio nigripulchritudo]
MKASYSSLKLLETFNKAKERLLSDYEVLNEGEFIKRLYQNGSSEAESLECLKQQKQVLYFKTTRELLYPTFQLASDFRIIGQLKERLPTLYEGLSGWDIGLWFINPVTIEICDTRLDDAMLSSLDYKTYDEVTNFINEAIGFQTNVLTAKPIDLLLSNDERLSLFFDDLIYGDKRNLEIRYISVLE